MYHEFEHISELEAYWFSRISVKPISEIYPTHHETHHSMSKILKIIVISCIHVSCIGFTCYLAHRHGHSSSSLACSTTAGPPAFRTLVNPNPSNTAFAFPALPPLFQWTRIGTVLSTGNNWKQVSSNPC